jgi:hypothetical protein
MSHGFRVASPYLGYHYGLGSGHVWSQVMFPLCFSMFEVCVISVWVMFTSHGEYVSVYGLDYGVSQEERTSGTKGGYDS